MADSEVAHVDFSVTFRLAYYEAERSSYGIPPDRSDWALAMAEDDRRKIIDDREMDIEELLDAAEQLPDGGYFKIEYRHVGDC
jgi:hypothetical protein